MPDVLEQLRHYGEAVEREALSDGRCEQVLDPPWWRRRSLVLLAAALLAVVVALGGVAVRLAMADAKVKIVANLPTTPPVVATTAPPPPEGFPTTAEDTSTTTTAGAPSSTTTSLGVRPAPSISVPGDSTPTTTTAGATTTTIAQTTTTTSASQPFTLVRGMATWTNGRDPRATLQVGACPVGDTENACGGWRVTSVAADGSFELTLPSNGSPREWNVVALVSPSQYSCAFNCFWRVSQAGRPTTISDAAPPATLDVAVTARVVDVFVRDKNNRPFQGGGVMVTDIRCPQRPCPSDQSQMFSEASSTDGSARIVVDPAQTYDLEGMAPNTGWPHSPTIRRLGSDIPEGHVFLVNGPPG